MSSRSLLANAVTVVVSETGPITMETYRVSSSRRLVDHVEGIWKAQHTVIWESNLIVLTLFGAGCLQSVSFPL
jgi:hypothetical protein